MTNSGFNNLGEDYNIDQKFKIMYGKNIKTLAVAVLTFVVLLLSNV